MWLTTRDTNHVTRNTWHVACDTWHVTRDTWHKTRDTWHVKRDTCHMTRVTVKCLTLLMIIGTLWLYCKPVKLFHHFTHWIEKFFNRVGWTKGLCVYLWIELSRNVKKLQSYQQLKGNKTYILPSTEFIQIIGILDWIWILTIKSPLHPEEAILEKNPQHLTKRPWRFSLAGKRPRSGTIFVGLRLARSKSLSTSNIMSILDDVHVAIYRSFFIAPIPKFIKRF